MSAGMGAGTACASLALLVCVAAVPVAAPPVEASVHCTPAAGRFVYDCTIRLTRHGEPVPDAQLTVAADMPSMPMAHDVAPVPALPGREPGEYTARLTLEMAGEWALKLRLAAPIRDLLVVHQRFDATGAKPVERPRRR